MLCVHWFSHRQQHSSGELHFNAQKMKHHINCQTRIARLFSVTLSAVNVLRNGIHSTSVRSPIAFHFQSSSPTVSKHINRESMQLTNLQGITLYNPSGRANSFRSIYTDHSGNTFWHHKAFIQFSAELEASYGQLNHCKPIDKHLSTQDCT